MRKIVFIVLALALSAEFAAAKSFSELKVNLSENINRDCGLSSGFDPIRGCYVQAPEKSKGSQYQIYLRSDLPPVVFNYVLLYEIGWFFLHDLYGDELTVFNPPPDKLARSNIYEIAVENWINWFQGAKVTAAQNKFFTDLLLKYK